MRGRFRGRPLSQQRSPASASCSGATGIPAISPTMTLPIWRGNQRGTMNSATGQNSSSSSDWQKPPAVWHPGRAAPALFHGWIACVAVSDSGLTYSPRMAKRIKWFFDWLESQRYLECMECDEVGELMRIGLWPILVARLCGCSVRNAGRWRKRRGLQRTIDRGGTVRQAVWAARLPPPLLRTRRLPEATALPLGSVQLVPFHALELPHESGAVGRGRGLITDLKVTSKHPCCHLGHGLRREPVGIGYVQPRR